MIGGNGRTLLTERLSRRAALQALAGGAAIVIGGRMQSAVAYDPPAASSPAGASTSAATTVSAARDGQHGVSLLGSLSYPRDFTAFDYVNPDAPKGGSLRLARFGSFDTVDTLHYPGTPPEDIKLVYDPLIVASDDEIASYYGVLADTVWVADDYSSLAFRIREAARWHDGRPVTVDDVVFTFERLQSRGVPFFRQALRPLSVFAEGPDWVVFHSTRAGDRDVVRRIAAIRIHPAHVWRDPPPSITPENLVGSGPYRLVDAEAPRQLVLERYPDYWGADLGVNRGRWNFDRLTVGYYRDGDIALEAFMAEDFDLRIEDSPSRWQNGYNGSALSSGRIRRTESPRDDRGEVHGVVTNLRQPALADRRVRMALALAYDFDAINRTLYAGAYQPSTSPFAGSDLAATGAAQGAELALLQRAGVDPDAAMLADPDPLAGLPTPGSRAALAEAARLLDEAGYPIRDLRRHSAVDGRPLDFELVSLNPVYNRPLAWLISAWERLGISVTQVRTDPASASRRLLDRDFDLATLRWSPARLPGTAERLLWHSGRANDPHSYALSGITSPELDAAIEALESARSPEALQGAGRAFERVFRHALLLMPLWRETTERIAWWNRFARPAAEENGFAAEPLERWWARV